MRQGLFIYGALLMAMCFAAGIYLASPRLMAMGLLACGAAALAHAVGEVYELMRLEGRGERIAMLASYIAFLSWFLAAVAAVSTFITLIAGA